MKNKINIVDTDIIKDKYLNNRNAINRLIKEYDEYKTLIVAYDFDDTVHDIDNEGSTYEQIRELLKVCKDMGFILIVFTCRPESEYGYVKEKLDEYGLPWDYFNEDAKETTFPKNNKKIFYNIFLDDRAGLRSAYEILVGTIDFILHSRRN